MDSRLSVVVTAAWWPALAIACWGLATAGGPSALAVPQPVRDASSLFLLWFVPGASWTRRVDDRSIGMRVVATIVVSVVVAQLLVAGIVIMDRGLRQDWLFTGLVGITFLGSMTEIVRHDLALVEEPGLVGEIALGSSALAVFFLIVLVSGLGST